MIRILFVIGIMGNGGAERVIAALSNEMVRNGNEVRIITIYGNKQDYYLDDSVELYPVFCKSKLKLLRPLERVRYIRNSIKEFKPDCIVSFLADVNIHTILACLNLQNPLIVSERNDPQNDPKQPWVRKLRDRLYKYADGFVFQTPDAEKYFKPYISGCDFVSVIPNPITPNLPYHKFDIENTRLITACRLNEQKNLKLMIDAVTDVINDGINCTLDIFGEGPQRDELQKYINDRNVKEKIKLRGFSNNIHNEMVNSAAFLISSDYEGISNSMIEALAIGLPVIATDCPVGGARMFIKDKENGFIVPVRKRDAMANAIKNVLNNRELANEIGNKAIFIREILNVEKITNDWELIIDAVTKKGAK